jgi:hypothetical protein
MSQQPELFTSLAPRTAYQVSVVVQTNLSGLATHHTVTLVPLGIRLALCADKF